MTSTKLTLFCLYLLLYCQCSVSANAPLNTTRQDSNPDTMDVSTDVIVTTVDTRVSSASPAERVVRKYVIGPLAFFGIGGNLLTLLVWSAEAGFNPTTFYIKVLAVSDIVLLGDYLLWHFHPLLILDTLPLLSYGLEVYSRSVSVYATLAVVTTRWMAVYRPTQMKTLLTQRRVIISCLLMLLLCFLVGLPYVIISTYFPQYYSIVFYESAAVCMALPVIVLVCLNVSLVYKLCRHRSNPSLDTAARATRSSRFYRLLLAVVCLSVTTTIAYPLGFLVRVLVTEAKEEQYGYADCDLLLTEVGSLFQVLNSAVNVVFYLLFASQFRELLCRTFRCCVCRRRRASDLAMRTTTTRILGITKGAALPVFAEK